MTVQHVLAVVPVHDIDTAREWYTRLLGCEPDNDPMPSLVEWQPVPGAWIQVFVDPDRAGRTQLNLAVDDLDTEIAAVAARGIEVGDVIDANKGVRLAPVTDPDGNVVTLIGAFRVDY
jgi:catechol 2,3-dioxygenase-like lactoylglutathione lyase family enzyme